MATDASLLPSLPDAARVWVHPTVEPLADDTQRALLDQLDQFIAEWSSHQKDVQGGATILYDRFVILAGARTGGADPSGCAIDDATHAVDAAAAAHDIDWVPPLHVLYRGDDGAIHAVSRAAFQDHAEADDVTTETPVFDPSVTTLGEVRDGAFQQPAGESWHAEAFDLPIPS